MDRKLLLYEEVSDVRTLDFIIVYIICRTKYFFIVVPLPPWRVFILSIFQQLDVSFFLILKGSCSQIDDVCDRPEKSI